MKRPQLERALSRLGKGDTLVVWRLDRVGRNLRHLIETVQDLEGRGIGFRSLDENIDTTTAMGKLVLRRSWGALAKFDRDLKRRAENRGPAAASEAANPSLMRKSEPWRHALLQPRPFG